MKNRILTSRRRSMPLLRDAVLSPESSMQKTFPEIEAISGHFPNKDTSSLRRISSRLYLSVKRKIKLIKDTGGYCLNVFKDWVGYTFCCIIVRKRKTPGVIKSVKI